VVCYERVCYERVCYEHGLLWKWSVFNRSVVNVVCFEWSVMNGLLWTGLFWMGTLTHTLVCKITSQELRMRIKSTQENLSSKVLVLLYLSLLRLMKCLNSSKLTTAASEHVQQFYHAIETGNVVTPLRSAQQSASLLALRCSAVCVVIRFQAKFLTCYCFSVILLLRIKK